MVRVVYQECLRHAIYNEEPLLSLSRFAFFKHSSWCKKQVIKKFVFLVYFHDSAKRNFCIRDPCFSIFSVDEPCQRPPPPCTTLIIANSTIMPVSLQVSLPLKRTLLMTNQQLINFKNFVISSSQSN